MMPKRITGDVLFCGVLLVVSLTTAQVPRAGDQLMGSDRGGGSRAVLAAAFPDIDRLFAEFAKTAHVPGGAWGIVIDGRLAHAGAAGIRDVAANAPVDTDTVFRIASMRRASRPCRF